MAARCILAARRGDDSKYGIAGALLEREQQQHQQNTNEYLAALATALSRR